MGNNNGTGFLLGDIRIDRVVETIQPYDTLGNFFPGISPEQIDLCQQWLEPRALCPDTGRIILVVQSYLVRTRHHTILIDTCIGCDKSIPWFLEWNQRSDRSWLQRLASCGVTPGDIDYVFCTHLHGDHVGWNTQLHDGRWVPTFPNARYVMSREDFEVAQAVASVGYNQNVLPVVETGQAVIVESGYALDDNLWLEPTPGHTAGHVAVGLASNGSEAVMCGDLMHCPVQCRFPDWHSSFDDDPALAAVTRRQFLEDNCERNRLVMTAHFPEPSVGRFVREDSAFRFAYEDLRNP